MGIQSLPRGPGKTGAGGAPDPPGRPFLPRRPAFCEAPGCEWQAPSPRSPGPTHTPGWTVLCSDPWLQASPRHCGGRRGAGGARHSAPTPRSLPLAGKRPQAQPRTRWPGPGRSPGAGMSGWLTLGGACEESISSPQPPSFCPQTRVASQRPTPATVSREPAWSWATSRLSLSHPGPGGRQRPAEAQPPGEAGRPRSVWPHHSSVSEEWLCLTFVLMFGNQRLTSPNLSILAELGNRCSGGCGTEEGPRDGG